MILDKKCERNYPCILSAQGPHEKCFYYFPEVKEPRLIFRNMNQAELEVAGSRHIHIFNFEGVCECGRSLMQEI